jgi:hypothetical protein
VSKTAGMRLRVFVNKSFARFALKKAIDSAELCRSMRDAENGLIDAGLGGGAIKQRIVRSGGSSNGGEVRRQKRNSIVAV